MQFIISLNSNLPITEVRDHSRNKNAFQEKKHAGLGELFVYRRKTKISGYITKAKKGDYDQVFHIEANLDKRTVSLTTNNTITRYAVREALRVVVKYARWSNLSAVRRSLNFDDMEGNVDVEIPSNQLGDLLPLDYAMQSLYTAGFPRDSRTPEAEDIFSLVWSPDNDAEISDIRPVSVEILPQDLLIKILTEYLSLKDAPSVCQTSRRLSVLRRTPQFWARKLLIDHKCMFTFREGSNRDYELLEDTYKAMNDFEL